jgi:hypothetical protein
VVAARLGRLLPHFLRALRRLRRHLGGESLVLDVRLLSAAFKLFSLGVGQCAIRIAAPELDALAVGPIANESVGHRSIGEQSVGTILLPRATLVASQRCHCPFAINCGGGTKSLTRMP